MVGYNSDRTQQCHMSHHFIIIIYINLGRSYSVGSMPGLAMRCKKIQVSLAELISSRPPVGSIFSRFLEGIYRKGQTLCDDAEDTPSSAFHA